MPVITVTLTESYDDDTRRALSERLADAARSVIAAPGDGVTVIIDDMAPGTPGPSPRETVERYLAAMEARDLDLARTFLADSFTMTFPGGATFTTPEELVAWARPRYRSIAKTYERFDEAAGAGDSIVYCFGTLNGEWPDGQPFSGIRFIDRFTARDGRLTSQEVWNDLAEVRRGTMSTP